MDGCDDGEASLEFQSDFAAFTIPYWEVDDDALDDRQEELRTCTRFQRWYENATESLLTCTQDQFTNDTSQTGKKEKSREAGPKY